MALKDKFWQNLLSRTASHAVPSGIQALTSLFGMDRGVAPVFNHQNKLSFIIAGNLKKEILKNLQFKLIYKYYK